MRLRLTIYLILHLFDPKLFGQPSWLYTIQRNLNSIDSMQLKECLADGHLCYFGDIEIDSTTDLSRLDQISFLEEVTLVIKLASIPAEFKNVKFTNLKKLRIHCGQNLTSHVNLKYFKSIEELSISNFIGDKLDVDFSKLINLKSLGIISAPNIVRMDNIFEAPKLESIRLVAFPSLKIFTTDTLNRHKNLIQIVLANCPLFDIKNIKIFVNLKTLSIIGSSFTSIPNYFPKSLTFLAISNNQTLFNIENIDQYINLKDFYLKDNPLLKDLHWKNKSN